MQDDILLKEKYTLLLPHLDEKSKRLYLASEAIGFGRGGLVKVAKLSKLSRVTIAVDAKELRSYSTINSGKTTIKDSIRKPGGGRKKLLTLTKDCLKNSEN
jgi:hypothetical protein